MSFFHGTLDRRLRRRAAVVGAIVAVVVAGSAATVVRLTGVEAASVRPAAPSSAALGAATPAPPDTSGARTRVAVLLLGAQGVLRNGADKAPPELLAQLQRAMDAVGVALDGDDGDAITAASDVLSVAQAAVETSIGAWTTEQARMAAEVENQRQAAQAQADATAAKKAAAAADRQGTADRPAAADRPATGSPPVAVAPAPVAVLAPPSAPPASPDPLTAGRDANAWFTAHLVGIGATGFTVSSAWELCAQPDSGPRYIQGCARSDQPTVIFMKPVEVALASTEVARGVMLHEWSHLLQYRLGFVAAAAAADAVYGAGVGLEQSADCMAIQLGGQGKPGGYTSDCAGARATLAAAFLAGRLS